MVFPPEYAAPYVYVEYVTAIDELSRVRGSFRNHRGVTHIVGSTIFFLRQRGAEKEIRSASWRPEDFHRGLGFLRALFGIETRVSATLIR